MDIPIHADVICHGGAVGKSSHIIVDLVSEKVTHFVLKTDHDHQEFVVPVDMIMDSLRTTILLDCNMEEVYQLPLFQESQFNGFDAYESAPPIPMQGVTSTHTMYHPYRMAQSGTQNNGEESYSAELALNKGAKVLATDGEVGRIDELVIDPETYCVTHLVLRQHNLLGKWIIGLLTKNFT